VLRDRVRAGGKIGRVGDARNVDTDAWNRTSKAGTETSNDWAERPPGKSNMAPSAVAAIERRLGIMASQKRMRSFQVPPDINIPRPT